MKNLILILILLPTCVFAQRNLGWVQNEIAEKQRSQQRLEWEKARKNIYRIVNGKTNCIADPEWKLFSGKIIAVYTNGVLIDGYCYAFPQNTNWVLTQRNIFIKNFPNGVTDNYIEYEVGMLTREPTIAFENIAGQQSSRIPCLDYGIPWTPPSLTAEQIAAQKAAQASARAIATSNSLRRIYEYRLERATAGDADSQYRLWELLSKGEGCEKDDQAAQSWLRKAAAQGHEAAKKQLSTQ